MLVRWCFPVNFLVTIFSIYVGFAVPHLRQSHISSHILFRSLIVVKVTMASPWRHDVGCEGESSENFLYFRLVNYNIPAKWRWFFSLFINRTTVFFEKQQRFWFEWPYLVDGSHSMSHLRMAQNEQSHQKIGQFQIQKRPVVSKTVPQIKGRQNHAMLEPWVICPMSGVTRPGKSQAFEVSCRAGLNVLAWRVAVYIFSTYMNNHEYI